MGNEKTELTLKLLALIEKTGYKLEQENGQRRYGPKPGAAVPARGSEIFIARIPRDCFEDELVPVFTQVGPIYEMRLLMDFSGTNRGYAFVMYETPELAQLAIQKLHGYQIRPGHKLGAVLSVDNRRLYIGEIPRDATAEQLLNEINQQVKHKVVDITMYSDYKYKNQNRGFAFVEFETHRAASKARRALVNLLRLQGRQLRVDWAEPEPQVPVQIMKKVRAIYLRNFNSSTHENTIRRIVEIAIGTKVQRVKKIKDYAFVHFNTREEAECALMKLNGAVIDSQPIEAKWAKPVDRELYHQQKQMRGNSKYSEILSPVKQNSDCSKESVCVSPNPVVLHSQDLLVAPIKLEAICKKYGWPEPVYYRQPYGCYWIVQVVLPAVGPHQTALVPLPCGPCPTPELADCAAAFDMLQLLQNLNTVGYFNTSGATVGLQVPAPPIRTYGI